MPGSEEANSRNQATQMSPDEYDKWREEHRSDIADSATARVDRLRRAQGNNSLGGRVRRVGLALAVLFGGGAAVAVGPTVASGVGSVVDSLSTNNNIPEIQSQTPEQTTNNNNKILADFAKTYPDKKLLVSGDTLRINLSGLDFHTGIPFIVDNPDQGEITVPGQDITSFNGIPIDPNKEDVDVSQAFVADFGENTTGNGTTDPWMASVITTVTNSSPQLAFFAYTHETENNVRALPNTYIGEVTFQGTSSSNATASANGAEILFSQLSRTATVLQATSGN